MSLPNGRKRCGNCRHFRYYLKRRKKFGIECGSCINCKACAENDSPVPNDAFPSNAACRHWKPWKTWRVAV